ncbi:peptidoglycan-binding domain-containing protein [Geobacillus subterraneus]
MESKAIVPYPGKPLKLGSKGKDVERIQRALKIKADGIFGKQTEAAVKAYQKRKGLAADGVVGEKTWNTLF